MAAPSAGPVETKKEETKPKNPVKEEQVWGLLNSSAAIHQDIRSLARKMDLQPPSMEDIKKNMLPVGNNDDDAKDADAAIEKLAKESAAVGGASGKKNAGANMTEADAACYASRYSDLGKETAKKHFQVVGNAQGRTATCARDISDFEAEDYLHQFPELQQKFGMGPSAVK